MYARVDFLSPFYLVFLFYSVWMMRKHLLLMKFGVIFLVNFFVD